MGTEHERKMPDWNMELKPVMFQFDPIPFWVIPDDAWEKFVDVQLDSMIEMKKLEMTRLEKFREIVAGKCK